MASVWASKPFRLRWGVRGGYGNRRPSRRICFSFRCLSSLHVDPEDPDRPDTHSLSHITLLHPHCPDEPLNRLASNPFAPKDLASCFVGSRPQMLQPVGEAQSDSLPLDLDRRLKLKFHGASVTSDPSLPGWRELDDAFGLRAIADRYLLDSRTERNGSHDLAGMLRQPLFGRFAGYDHHCPRRRTGRGKCVVSARDVRSNGERKGHLNGSKARSKRWAGRDRLENVGSQVGSTTSTAFAIDLAEILRGHRSCRFPPFIELEWLAQP